MRTWLPTSSWPGSDAAAAAVAAPPDARAEPGQIGWRDCPLGQEIFIIHNRMMRIADRVVGPLGLTGSRWLLLGALERYERPPTLSELSEDALLSVQNVSRMVAAMEDDGLVERFSEPGRGRAVFVRMTEHGLHIKQQARAQGRRFAEVFLAGLSAHERAEAQRVLHQMIHNLERFDELDPGGDPHAAD